MDYFMYNTRAEIGFPYKAEEVGVLSLRLKPGRCALSRPLVSHKKPSSWLFMRNQTHSGLFLHRIFYPVRKRRVEDLNL